MGDKMASLKQGISGFKNLGAGVSWGALLKIKFDLSLDPSKMAVFPEPGAAPPCQLAPVVQLLSAPAPTQVKSTTFKPSRTPCSMTKSPP